MEELSTILSVNVILIAVCLVAIWVVSLRLKDVSIVDVFWGLGFVFVVWMTATLVGFEGARSWLLVTLTTLWGLRLSLYLFWRNWGHGEDFRYRAMRERIGSRFWIVSLFLVFGLQGCVMWIVSLPIQAGQLAGTVPLGWFDIAGVIVWTLGMLFESIGDWQLAQFKRNPANRGKVLRAGLWALTRHPNYFGDFCVWWGLYLIAVGAGARWTIVGPLVMSYFLMRVSGVPMLERSISKRRPAYEEYVASTNAFFPGWPRQRR